MHDQSPDDLDEIKRSLNFMSSELTKVTTRQELLMKLFEKIKQLKIQSNYKDKQIAELERVDDLVTTGLEIKNRQYTKVVTNEGITEDSVPQELTSLEDQIVNFLQDRDIEIHHKDISICHTLPSKTEKFKPVVKFISRKARNKVIMQARKLQGTRIFINEHLTKRNGAIAREAPLFKKQQKIVSTWTKNGNIWIKVKETSQAKVIRDLKDLGSFR